MRSPELYRTCWASNDTGEVAARRRSRSLGSSASMILKASVPLQAPLLEPSSSPRTCQIGYGSVQYLYGNELIECHIVRYTGRRSCQSERRNVGGCHGHARLRDPLRRALVTEATAPAGFLAAEEALILPPQDTSAVRAQRFVRRVLAGSDVER